MGMGSYFFIQICVCGVGGGAGIRRNSGEGGGVVKLLVNHEKMYPSRTHPNPHTHLIINVPINHI